jgi:hypothetical protein
VKIEDVGQARAHLRARLENTSARRFNVHDARAAVWPYLGGWLFVVPFYSAVTGHVTTVALYRVGPRGGISVIEQLSIDQLDYLRSFA